MWLCFLCWLSSGGRLSASSCVVSECSNVFLILNEDSNWGTKRDILGSLGEEKLSNVAFLLHLEIDGRLISLDTSKNNAWLDFIADLQVPLLNVSLEAVTRCRRKLTFSMVGDRLGISSLT